MNLENYYISGLPIKCKDLGIIYQPTIKELFELDITYNDITLPFIYLEKIFNESNFFSKFQVIKDLHEISETLNKVKMENINAYELIMKSFGENFNQLDVYEGIIKSLKLLYKSKDVVFVKLDNIEGFLIKYDDKKLNHVISINNFDSLYNIIFEMFYIDKRNLFKKDEDDITSITGSKRESELIDYFKKRQDKKKEKNTLYLCDYINIVAMIGKYDYETVLNMTHYQLMNAYRTLMYIKNYNEELLYRISLKYDIKEEPKNWIEGIKLDNSTVKF